MTKQSGLESAAHEDKPHWFPCKCSTTLPTTQQHPRKAYSGIASLNIPIISNHEIGVNIAHTGRLVSPTNH